jgi:flavodoxin
MMKTIVIVCSYHHKNTEKVAGRIADVLGARTVTPQQVDNAELEGYDLIGFGSGIYDAKHHTKLLELADSLPHAQGKKAFLFSTDGMPRFVMKSGELLKYKMQKDHSALRQKLQAKGYTVIGEFNCAGYNTNSYLKLFGGINKGRPDQNDFALAAMFAKELKKEMQ